MQELKTKRRVWVKYKKVEVQGSNQILRKQILNR